MFQAFLPSPTAFINIPEDCGSLQSLNTRTRLTARQEVLQYFKVLYIIIIFNILRNILTIYNKIILIEFRGM